MSGLPFPLTTVAAFSGLSDADRARLEERLEPVTLNRGDAIVRQGEPADALYIVVSGRFTVEAADSQNPLAEIGPGQPIGEIAFFAGGTRSATVVSHRDSVVLKLSRADFDEISHLTPSIWRSIMASLADRLRTETALKIKSGADAPPAHIRPRTLAIVPAGVTPLSEAFIARFKAEVHARELSLFLTSANAAEHVPPGIRLEDIEATRALNKLENRFDTVVYIADNTLTPWSEKAIRQADEVLLVSAFSGPSGADPDAAVPLNKLEAFSLKLHGPSVHRLVLLHRSKRPISGTRHWLAARTPQMHHHVGLDRNDDIARLWRFIRGDATGLVLSGGGAYSAAHVGVYKTLCENNLAIDMYGGTSGGAAMAAAFAQDLPADEIDRRVGDMFVTGRALGRYTLPFYSVLDHKTFDRHLAALYGATRIEDLWKPYFAVSANLTEYRTEVHRAGPLWQAIRASAAIPALLPPVYTVKGDMLVDGSIMANVPVEMMRRAKAGPNIIVCFKQPKGERFEVDYGALPSRGELLWSTIFPWRRAALPNAPSPGSVLMRSLMAGSNHFDRHVAPNDWLIVVPVAGAMSTMDWRRHSEVMASAAVFTQSEFAERTAAGKSIPGQTNAD